MARETSLEMHKAFAIQQAHQGQLAPSKTGRDALRLKLYERQNGVCYWREHGKCRLPDMPMSLERVKVSETGKIKHNPLFASFEHIVRRYDGGTWRHDNLALAHQHCNHHREKGLPPNGMKWRHLLPDAHLRKNGNNNGQAAQGD